MKALRLVGLVVAFSFTAAGCSQEHAAAPPATKSEEAAGEAPAELDPMATAAPTLPASPQAAASAAADVAPRPAPRPRAFKGEAKEKGKSDKDGKKASTTTWKRSKISPHSSKLMIGDHESLPLKAMQVKARVDGFRARVVVDYYYQNDKPRQYEGTFKMRLPNGASPYFLAFGKTLIIAGQQGEVRLVDFVRSRQMGATPQRIMDDRQAQWESVKEARMVPRQKAALAYHDTVRRAVDPALMEWAGPGMFSARVFPLEPSQTHRIVVGYDMDLLTVDDRLVLQLDVPEDVPQKIVDVDIAEPAGSKLTLTKGTAQSRTTGRRHVRYENPAEQTIEISVAQPKPWLLSGSDASGEYFATSFVPKLPARASDKQRSRPAVLMLDTSLSSNPDRYNVWLKLARAILEKNSATIPKFNAVFFNVEQDWWQNGLVDNNEQNRERFFAAAEDRVLEGATDIHAALRDAAGHIEADVFLLSDGAATWGESNLYAMTRKLKGTLFAYRTGMSGTDGHALSHLARETGGAVFSVVGEAQVEAAAVAHRRRPLALSSLEAEGGSDLMIAGRPGALFRGQRIMVVGRGTPRNITLSAGGHTIETKLASPLRSDLAPRSFGSVAVLQLEDFAAATEKVATAYANHFRITGKSSSLLMLESEVDYRNHNIVPENDIAVVKESPAAARVASTLSQIEDTLGDPKASMLAWLHKMQTTPGVTLSLSERFLSRVKAMPSEAFALGLARLDTKITSPDALTASFLGRLKSKSIDYDIFFAEAERRRKYKGPADGLKAFSSMIENNPGDGVLARDVAYYALQHKMPSAAYHLLRRVADTRPHEPQTYLALARAAADADKHDLALIFYEVALAGSWHTRFGDFKTIAQVDYMRTLRKLPNNAFAKERLAALSQTTPVQNADLVVVLTWNTDNSDVDLHVDEPTGEECYYSHPKTRIGGQLTKDVTQGYGPEMYSLKKAPRGSYTVRAKYFASDSNRASARTKVQAMIFENFGRTNERVTEKVITLERGKDMHTVATIRL